MRLPVKVGWRHDLPTVTSAFVLSPLRAWERLTRTGDTATSEVQRLALVARCVASEAQALAVTLDDRARMQHIEENPPEAA